MTLLKVEKWLNSVGLWYCIQERTSCRIFQEKSYGNPLQCSCLENPRDRIAWWVVIYGVAQSRTRLKLWLSSSSLWAFRWYLISRNLGFLTCKMERISISHICSFTYKKHGVCCTICSKLLLHFLSSMLWANTSASWKTRAKKFRIVGLRWEPLVTLGCSEEVEKSKPT